MTFSTNQVRHLYVANVVKDSIASSDKAGSIVTKSDKEKTQLYFEYMGAGGLTRSDLIDIKSITHAKATDATDLAYKLVKHKVVLDSTVNGGIPVAGQDYLLRIAFKNYIGLSEENQYFKYGMVHAISGMTASDFYKTLILSLVKNFSREEEGTLKFYLEVGGTDSAVVTSTTEVTKNTKATTLLGVYTGIVIEEAPQDWILGVFPQRPLNFEIQPDTIIADGDSRIWGVSTKVASTSSIPDGKNIADLEYFCMGERGDIYRGMGFPNIIRTKYLVDPEVPYNVIDIHYSFQGEGTGVQKSEKDITIVIPKVGDTNAVSNKLTNDLIGKINAATNLKIELLAV